MVVNGASRNGSVLNGTVAMELHLQISDSDLIAELSAYEEGEVREEFAISAMKIGTIALRQAQGRIDADTVRHEGELFIESMSHALHRHRNEVTGQIGTCLKEYFDPDSGRFNERVKRLVDGDDGDIARLIRGQIAGDGSELAQTLTQHVGKESPLMQTLDINATDGLINTLVQSTEETLSAQRDLILKEFSLDNTEGALNRLVSELNKKHEEVGESLENRIDEVVGEFSLDKEDSALSRLVGQVEKAQRQISNQFSLDEEGSALARMQKKLLEALDDQQKENRQFQEDVNKALANMNTRKEESMRGTQHGIAFEDQVLEVVSKLNLNTGDLVTHTGKEAGRTPRSFTGDVVVKLGDEHAAAGASIVIEAKANKSYTPEKALDELEDAKKNRDASIGLFVWASRTAPEGTEIFNRYGNNIVVVWDEEDPSTDIVLRAGLSVAKALCVRAKAHSDETGEDFKAIEDATQNIKDQIESLTDIKKWANTIKTNSTKILKNADKTLDVLNEAIDVLNTRVDRIKHIE